VVHVGRLVARRCSFVGLASLNPITSIIPIYYHHFLFLLALSTPSQPTVRHPLISDPHHHLSNATRHQANPTLAPRARRRRTHVIFILIDVYIFFSPANDLARYLLRTPISFFFPLSYSWPLTRPLIFLRSHIFLFIYWSRSSVLANILHTCAPDFSFLLCIVFFTPFGVASGRCTLRICVDRICLHIM
jgi:hypothetical protein